MSKSKKLLKEYGPVTTWSHDNMEEALRRHAMEFIKWGDDNFYIQEDEDRWAGANVPENHTIHTAKLYSKFNLQK